MGSKRTKVPFRPLTPKWRCHCGIAIVSAEAVPRPVKSIRREVDSRSMGRILRGNDVPSMRVDSGKIGAKRRRIGMKLVTWNIQWGLGLDARVDLARIVSTARELADFDVLCMQEVADNFPAPGLEA